MRKLVLFLLFVCWGQFNSLFAFSVEQIVNPKTSCANCYVANQDAILSSSATDRINQLLHSLNQRTGIEIAVVAINGGQNTSARDVSMELFDAWKIGKKGEDNGIIVILTKKSREVFIRTGYGIEGILTDALSTRIVNKYMIPYFKQEKWDEGFLSGVSQIVRTLEKSYENNSKSYENKTKNYFIFSLFYLIISLIYFTVAIILIYKQYSHIDNNFKLEKIKALKQKSNSWIIVGIVFLPGLLLLLIWIYCIAIRKIKKSSVQCSCSNKMRLLSEKEEDKYLSRKAQIEEEIGSKNYDVWLCEKCGNTVIYPYDKILSNYSECPSCKAKTYYKQSEKVLKYPTSFRNGIMRKTFRCKNCNHISHIDSDIPRSGGVIVGGMGSGSSFGGGFSGGGSWGGGFSGGGGGGGRF
ncbi:MAG: TPM domain-containing protein [Bacteroidales bacterium]|nr:TPM domain-containing protein [Bacteroidales bacterium]